MRKVSIESRSKKRFEERDAITYRCVNTKCCVTECVTLALLVSGPYFACFGPLLCLFRVLALLVLVQ